MSEYKEGGFMDMLRMEGTTDAEELYLRHEISDTRAEKHALYDEIERLHEEYEIANSVEADKIYHQITIRQNVYDAMVEHLNTCIEKMNELRYAKHMKEEEK